MRTTMTMVATLLLAAGPYATRAATNFWDNNDTTAGFGAAGGTWGTEQKWSSDATGVAAPGTTTTTTADDLHLGTSVNGLSAGTVTVSGAAQGFGQIRFGQASGEITLSGGTLDLATPMAGFVLANDSNTVGSVLAGAAGIQKVGTVHYGAFLTGSAVTIFTGARLADYDDADGIMGGAWVNGGNPVAAEAYHFSNDGSTATYQLQVYDGGHTKCVKVELTQSGANIAGRVVYAKYYPSQNNLGFDFDGGGNGGTIATSYVAGGYGAAETFLTTTRDHTHFLTGTAATILSNANLADVTAVDGIMGGSSISGGAAAAEPYYFSNDGSTCTYQLQCFNGGYTKCVKIELTQAGTDVQGRVLYAKYYNDVGVNHLGFDFDTGGTGNSIATSYGAGGYGAAETFVSFVNESATLTLTGVNTYSGATRIGGGTLAIGGSGQLGSGSYAGTVINDGQFLYDSSANQVLTGAISGTGAVVKATAASHSYLYHNAFLTSVAATIFTGATLSDYEGADGVMGGAAVASTVPFPADAYHFSNNGSTATFQLQIYEGGHTKCVKIELTQVGSDIQGRVLYAKYLLSQNGLGFDFDTGGNGSGIATSYTGGGYGAAEITIVTHDNSKLRYQVANTYSGGTAVNGGILETVSSASTLPSSGAITVGSGGHLRLWVGGMSFNSAGGVGNGNPITVSGGRLTLAGRFNAGYSRLITIDGGVLNSTASDGDNSNYMNNLALSSGARVTGKSIRVGNFTAATIAVSGTSASSISAGVRLVNTSGGTRPLTLNVADATGDADADLTVSGPIWDFTGLTGMPIIKTGDGTVEFSGANTYVGLTQVDAGTLALGAANTLDGDNNIVLNGGGLDTGDFNNTLGTLTVNGSSHMILGDGELAFADVSGVTWTGTLALTGTLRDHTLRFGNSDEDLTVDQLESISIDGNPVYIDEDGYLLRAANGTLFQIR
jgi:fibronectin-binding autotransporter adhesin